MGNESPRYAPEFRIMWTGLPHFYRSTARGWFAITGGSRGYSHPIREGLSDGIGLEHSSCLARC